MNIIIKVVIYGYKYYLHIINNILLCTLLELKLYYYKNNYTKKSL